MQIRSDVVEPSLDLPFAIRECLSEEDIECTYKVMRQLRPHLMPRIYIRLVDSLRRNEGFRIFAAFDQQACVGVLGFQEQNRLGLGRVLYIADLVTDRERRSQGIARGLLNRVKEEARKMKIESLVLESREDKGEAVQFYKRYGFKMNAYGIGMFAGVREGQTGPFKVIKVDG